MSTWKQSKVGVLRSLRLDPDNVRLALSPGASQREVIAALYSAEDVISLAKSIVSVGWLTLEYPIALKEGSGFVVVEGNRRVAALKGLIQPSLVPEYRARLEKLAEQTDTALLKKIKVTLAPGLREADMLIAALHTGNLRKGWGRSRQAVFFERLLEDGYSPQELIEGFPTVEVRDLLRRGSMTRLFLGGLRQDPALFDYFNAPRTPMTILERLTDNPDFLAMARIEIDPETFQASTSLDAAAFEALAEAIVSDMKTGAIDTRVLNGPELASYQKYLSKVQRIIMQATPSGQTVRPAPNTRQAAPLSPNDDNSPLGQNGSTPITTEKKATSETPPPPAARTISTLDFTGITVSSDLPRPIAIITEELMRINYRKFPNATYDLLRSYLEKSIHAYAEYCGEKVAPKKQGQAVGLEACLIWLESHTGNQANGLRNFRHSVQLLRDQKAHNRSTTLGLMNSVNHNPELSVQAEHVLNLWTHLHGIIKFLVDPSIKLKAQQ